MGDGMELERVLELVGVVVASVAAGGLGSWLLKAWKQKQEGAALARDASRQERKDAIGELNEIVATLRSDLTRAEDKADRALADERECEKKWIRAVSYIEYIGYEARRQGWPIRPWSEHGTDVHEPLTPGRQAVTDPNQGDSGKNWNYDRRRADDPTRKGPDRRRPPARKSRGGGPPDPKGGGADQGQAEPHGPPVPRSPDLPSDDEQPPPAGWGGDADPDTGGGK